MACHIVYDMPTDAEAPSDDGREEAEDREIPEAVIEGIEDADEGDFASKDEVRDAFLSE